MRQPNRSSPRQFIADLLSFDRLMTGPVLHLIYWAGLAIIVLMGLSVVGASVGVALRGDLVEWLLAIPALVIGLLVITILTLLWRGFCEFYLVIFRISEDLRALRLAKEAEKVQAPPPPRF